jgi:hypothetical protein
MQHVHPNEFEDYFRGHQTIIRGSGQAIISGNWTDGQTLQFGAVSGWIHRSDISKSLVSRNQESRVTQGRRDRGFEAGREAAPLAVRVTGDAGGVSHYA